jgi:tripartite-type tricarboxylate transporter receptor subunit TctC
MNRFLALLLWLFCSTAFPQSFPSKPIRVLVPFPAGGTTDIVARLVAQRMSEQVGQPVLVENRAGAGGTIAAAEVARSAPDGYTLLIHNVTFPIASVAAALANRATYNADADFAGVSIAVYVPFVWTANPATPGKDLREAMTHVKQFKPYTYGSTGPGSTMHVLGEALGRAASVEMTHVPFKGAAPLKQELIAGRIHLGGDQLSSSLADIKAGKLKALATSASRRIPELPDVPTVRELGYPVLEADGWNGFFAPAKTPRDIVERLYQEIRKAKDHPEVKAKLAASGGEPMDMTPAAFQDYIRKSVAMNHVLAKAAGIKPQ